MKRLEKVKQHIYEDEDIMWDLLDRHNGMLITPQQMKEEDPNVFDHAIGNFSASVLYCMIDNGIYKL